jgi:hypothetical protein
LRVAKSDTRHVEIWPTLDEDSRQAADAPSDDQHTSNIPIASARLVRPDYID